MRSNTLLLLAGLASYAVALPTADVEARHFGLTGGLVDTITDILHGHSPANILDGLSSEAAAALSGSALGCRAGSVDKRYRKALKAWIHAEAGVHLDVGLKKTLLAWCDGDDSFTLSADASAALSVFISTSAHIAAKGDLYVSLDGVFSLAERVLGVLSASAQATLSSALEVIGELDWKIKTGLEFIAAGGVVSDLSVDVIVALKAWLSSSECSLSVSLKTTLLAWCEGRIEGDVVALHGLPVGGLTAISVGNAVQGLVEETGVLVASAQTSLSVFLETEIGLSLDADIKVILAGCAKGERALSFDYEARAALSAWIASSQCKLTAELKAVVLFWLSFSVSADAEVSIDLSHSIIAELSSFLLGTVDSLLGTHLHGLISLIVSGESVLSISLEARAQLAAICGGATGLDIDSSIQLIIVGWLTGCHECCGGTPPFKTGTPGLPASSSVIPTVAPTPIPDLPEIETHTVPSVPISADPIDQPKTESPTVPESSTPCETIISETVIASTISVPGKSSSPVTTEAAVPTASSPVEPSGPVAEASTPCETIISETVIPSTISHSAAAPTITSPPQSVSTGKTITITTTVSVPYCPPEY